MHHVEEKLYEMAGEELVTKRVNRGVWAKAFATAQGNEARTKATYIELRVAQLREQVAVEAARRNETVEQGRKREATLIREHLGGLRRAPYRDDDSIPNSHFDKHPESLAYPVFASIVADALGCTETEIIIAIRSRYFRGVRHNGDWYVELQPVG